MARATRRGTRLVLLGTAGERRPNPLRSGPSQAVVVDDRAYVVDCGSGVGRQLVRARLLWRLHQVFVTHLHADHVADLFTLFLLSWPTLEARNKAFQVFGPSGLADFIGHQTEAYAYDIDVGTREGGHKDPTAMLVPREIAIPAGPGANGPDNVAPPMDPLLVAEDDAVRVTATLVWHPPVFPCFAYRFDTDDGSVVVSGDTAPSVNLVRLAQGADVLVHEVMDPDHDRVAPGGGGDEAARHRLRSSHTSRHDVGKVAAEAGVGKLVLSHFIPGWGVPEHRWVASARDHFDGEVILGEDLLEVNV